VIQMSASPLHLKALSLYKALQTQTKYLFDANARQFVSRTIESRFRDNLKESGAKRLSQLFKQGRQRLRLLKRANSGDVKSIDTILDHTYGRRGRRKHDLLKPFYDEPAAPTEPFIPGERRTAPPAIPASIYALMKADPNVNPEFELPNPPVYKPFAKRREVNAIWRHYAVMREALRAPLPKNELQQLHKLATKTTYHPTPAEWSFRAKVEAELHERRLTTGRYQGNFRRMSPRFMRRRYQRLIDDYIPVISGKEGAWKVEKGSGRVESDGFPLLDKRYLSGFKLPDGTKVGEVDKKGVFIGSGSTTTPRRRKRRDTPA